MFGFGRQPVTRLQFIVAGAQKSGTTALNYYLKRHSQIALPAKKELHFFDDDALFAEGEVDYQSLHTMFPPARAGSVAGENTPNYLYCPPAMERIRAYQPAIKLIFILRNPLSRAFSQWNMQRARGIEPLDFIPALQAEATRLQALPPLEARRFAYLDRGRYASQLARVFRLFPKEQTLILKYETFRERQREGLSEIFRFLGVKVPNRFRSVEAHHIPYARTLRLDERTFVSDRMRDENVQLEQLLGWDCADWR